eukprot:COSAG02_NODE_21080_length_803_cov_0.951705_2_plen_42_part_01
MSVSSLERPAARARDANGGGGESGWEQSGGGMIVRIAASEVE